MKIAITLLVAVLLVLQYLSYRKRKQLEEQNAKLQATIKENNQQYQEVVAVNRDLKHIRHDLQKQRNVMQELLQDTNPKEQTPNQILEVILGQKKEWAAANQIYFECMKISVSEWRMEIADTISLLTNLLDNALESAAQVEEKPYVRMQLQVYDGKGYIRIENAKRPNDHPLDNQMSTTKENRELHGLGTEIIRKIVEKYSGQMQIEDKGAHFVVTIWCQMEQE
jgi:signal transduction histidine kinase